MFIWAMLALVAIASIAIFFGFFASDTGADDLALVFFFVAMGFIFALIVGKWETDSLNRCEVARVSDSTVTVETPSGQTVEALRTYGGIDTGDIVNIGMKNGSLIVTDVHEEE